MILRRFAEALKQQNWAAIAIEFVLLVLGVFLGIQVANWNEALADERLGRAYAARLTGQVIAVDGGFTTVRPLGTGMASATGSPLPPEAYRWGYAHVKRDLWLVSIAGGTDLAGAFLTGLPTLPVYEGEMQCRCLGAAVQAWEEQGASVIDQVGELVCLVHQWLPVLTAS